MLPNEVTMGLWFRGALALATFARSYTTSSRSAMSFLMPRPKGEIGGTDCASETVGAYSSRLYDDGSCVGVPYPYEDCPYKGCPSDDSNGRV